MSSKLLVLTLLALTSDGPNIRSMIRSVDPNWWYQSGGIGVVIRLVFPMPAYSRAAQAPLTSGQVSNAPPETSKASSPGAVSKSSGVSKSAAVELVLNLLRQRCGACHAGQRNLLRDKFDLANLASLKGRIDGDDPRKWELVKYLEENRNHAPRSRLVTTKELDEVIAAAQRPRKKPSSDPSLVEIAIKEKRCTRFVRWARETGVWFELSSGGPYTIFAPTDEAIAKLPPELLAYIEKPENRKTILKDVLVNHGVADRIFSADLRARPSVDSILNVRLTLPVDSDGTQNVGNAKVIATDIKASNGVVHLIDEVLLPPGIVPKAATGKGVPIPVAGGIWLMEIEGGEFEMAGRPVKVASFYMSMYEITDDAFSYLMERDLEIKFPQRRQEHKSLPAEHLTWYEAVEFCNRLSTKEGLSPFYQIAGEGANTRVFVPDAKGLGFRLPTESEWEYACAAGAKSRFSFGEGELKDYAVFDENARRNSEGGWLTDPVGSKKANGFGLHDMYGNVAEWCFDSQPGTGKKVVRGGNYLSKAEHIGSAQRDPPRLPISKYHSLGFRVVRNVDQTRPGASFASLGHRSSPLHK